MSGGSWDYLCHADYSDSLASRVDDMYEMADRLAAEGAIDAARDTRAFADRCRVPSEIPKELRQIWKEVEWCDSCDSSRDELREAIKRYKKTSEASHDI